MGRVSRLPCKRTGDTSWTLVYLVLDIPTPHCVCNADSQITQSTDRQQMKINSIKKIKKQAAVWAEANAVKTNSVIDRLQKVLKPLTDKWDRIRDSFCPATKGGGACICSTHPEYQELVIEKILPLTTRINELWTRDCKAKNILLHKKIIELTRVREAKLKYWK